MTSIARNLIHALLLIAAITRFVVIPRIRQWFGLPVSARELGVKLRLFLDRSGLIYRKIGQYLAMRNDILPPSICEQLDLLFENATPMPYEEVRRQLEAELGRPIEESFAWFDAQPLGSASVAQVHRATAHDGQDLAVKIQRTGIQEQFAADVRLFRKAATLCDFLRLAGSLSIRDFLGEFARFTSCEMDFELEGRSAERLRHTMSPYGDVPAVRWDLTTRRVLTMQYVPGDTFLTICKLGESEEDFSQRYPGVDLHQTVSHLADECYRQLFTSGFFHGDPHPGNVVLRKDGTFVFLDCGITGDLSLDHKRDFRGYVENLALGRFSESAAYYTRLCVLTKFTDVDAWMYDVTAALAAWHASLRDPHSSLELRHMGHLQALIASAMRRHNVLARPDQILVWRTLILLDTTTLRLPIHFDVLLALVAFFRREKANLRNILLPFREWPQEVPALARATLAFTRSSLQPGDPHKPLTALRLRATGSYSGPLSASCLTCALASVVCASLAANSGGATVSSLSLLASAVFVLLVFRR
jgi:ubiquinone biosynthesis protein